MPAKQVIVVRRDLKLRRAEVAATVARISSMFFHNNREETAADRLHVNFSREESEWFYSGQKIIVLGVQSETTLKGIIDKADMQGLTVAVAHRTNDDEKMGHGRIPVAAAIGPHDDDVIDAITGNLRLM